MARNHVQPGRVIDVTLDDDYDAGDLVKVGDLAGVCLGSGSAGDSISVAIEEVYDVDKKSTDTFTAGQRVYLDRANRRLTESTDDGGSPLETFIAAGCVIEAAGSGVTTVSIKLNV